MRNIFWLALLGCTSGGEDGKKPGSTDIIDGDTDTVATTQCGEITAFTVSAGAISTSVELSIELDVAAPVVAHCLPDTDPTHAFFAESTDVAETHTLRMTGLFPDEGYVCTAAADCPGPSQTPAEATFFAEPPPNTLRRVTVEKNPALGMTGAWTLAPYNLQPVGGKMYVVVWGPQGFLRWWYPLPGGLMIDAEALYDLDRDEIVWGGGGSPDGRLRIVDLWHGETYAWSPPGWQDVMFHHDAKRLEDGRLITLETRENVFGNNSWDGFGVRVHDDVTGQVDLEIDSQRYVDEGVLRAAGGLFDNDPYHANWVDLKELATGPKLYVSLCFDESILALDGVTGDVLWHLGANKGWTLLDAAGSPLDDGYLPQCQHGLEILGDDHLLVYDNGRNRGFSTAQEWTIDPVTRTATQLWLWQEPGWDEAVLGDIDLLPDDRVLITAATFIGTSEIVEVDRATGDVASRIRLDSGGYTYRSERYSGCDLFSDTTVCDTLAARHEEVSTLLTP